MAMGQGICRKKKLWTSVGRKELQGLSLGPWASHRRQQLLDMLDQLEPVMEELDRAVMREAEKRPAAVHLMTQPGVGPVTALAFVLTIGPVSRFQRSKQVVNYLGFNPSEESSGGRQRLVYDPELRRDYQRLKFRRGRGVAKVASHEVGGTAVLEAA
jgi:transposase